jgi:hypothetical protein
MRIEGTLTKAQAIEQIENCDDGGNPRCPVCLSELHLSDTEKPYWECPNEECGNTKEYPVPVSEYTLTVQVRAMCSEGVYWTGELKRGGAVYLFNEAESVEWIGYDDDGSLKITLTETCQCEQADGDIKIGK